MVKTIKSKKRYQAGYTLIELLVAIAIFATFMTIASSSLVSTLKLEQKTNILRQTQTDTRYILETISREARSANGEFNSSKERVFPAYSFDPGLTKLTIKTTDLNAQTVTQKVYYRSGDTIRFDSQSKKVGDPGYGPLTSNAVALNNALNTKIIELNFTGSTSNSNLAIPPKLVISLKTESGPGRNFVKDQYRAYVELQTEVSPRNY